jgi:hypothetical protein
MSHDYLSFCKREEELGNNLESLFGIFLLIFLLVAVASFMAGNVLQGLGALGAIFLFGFVLRFFRSLTVEKEVSMPSVQRLPTEPSLTTVIREKEVVMIPCKYCGNLMLQTETVCPFCGGRRKQ